MKISRRELLATAAVAAWGSRLEAQGDPPPDWGGPIVDTHLHLRGTVDANHTHMQGCGVTHAVLRARDSAADQVQAIQQKYPGRFVVDGERDAAKPEAEALLTKAVKAGGAVGFGEIKSHVEADGPELRRLFSLAADLGRLDHGSLPGSAALRRRGRVCHRLQALRGDAEGVSEDSVHRPCGRVLGQRQRRLRQRRDYPTGPIARGGVTDKLLGDYANLYGDLSANSGNNALSRDAASRAISWPDTRTSCSSAATAAAPTAAALASAQANNPAASRLAGKCVARETLALLKRSTSPEVFRMLTWTNPRKLFKFAEA